MQLIVEKQSRRAVYLLDDEMLVVFQENGALCGSMLAAGVSIETHALLQVEPPLVWVAGVLAFDERWSVLYENEYRQAVVGNPAAAQRLQAAVVARTQAHLDAFAKSRNYDDVNSISKYQNISDAEIAALPAEDRPLVEQFRAECRYLAVATAQTWARLYQILGEIQAGTRAVPVGFDEIEASLPALGWPA